MSASVQTEEVLNITSKLKDKVAKSPALAALCGIFAKRERNRNEITVLAMYVNLIKEGRSFSKSQIKEAFKTLEEAGIGKLGLDSKQQIVSLKDIKVNLPEVGAALGLRADRRNQVFIEQSPPLKTHVMTQARKLVKIGLKIEVDDEIMHFNYEQYMSISEMFDMVTKSYGKGVAK